MLSTFVDTAADPRLVAFLVVGLAGSVLIGGWPTLKKFADNPSHHLRQLPTQALGIVRKPDADGTLAATPSLPRSVFLFGGIGVVLAAWTGYAFTQPANQIHTVQGTRWQNVTSFAFTGHGPPSNALPDGAVGPVSTESIAKAGSPPVLYSNVLTSLDFAFNYQMQSKQKLEVLGTGGAALRIKAQDGWERTLMLQPPQPLVGPDVTLWFSVNLDATRLVIAGVEKETGSHSDWYELSVVPVVRLVGQQGTQHIDETYAPEYHLRYDRVHITPDATMARTEPKAGPVQEQSLRRLHLLGVSISYALARWLGGLTAIAALASAVMLVPSKPKAEAPAPKRKPTAAPASANVAVPAPPLAARFELPPSPGTLRTAIQRNLAASAEMAALLADSVKASSNGGGRRNNGQREEGESSAGESSAA